MSIKNMKTLSLLQFKDILKDYLNVGFYYKWNPTSGGYHSYRNTETDEERKKKNLAEKRGWLSFEKYHTYTGGGSCWDEGPVRHYTETHEPESDEYEDFLTFLLEEIAPEITFLQFKRLKSQLKQIEKEVEFEINEYYGNHSNYYGLWFYVDELFGVLVESGIIKPIEQKHAILIGGLPCSGKTTLAKELYSDFNLVDDPFDLEKDIKPHLKKKKLVITSPHLSFKKDRELARELLESKGYFVEVELCDATKSVLRSRAKKLDKLDKVGEFIKNHKLEK